jgi:uroporphyrinogen decarboxylase
MMNAKELVMASIDRRRAERPPVDLYEGWMWPDIAARLQDRLHAHSEEELLAKLGACCRWVIAPYSGPALPPGAKGRVASPHTTHSLNAPIWGLGPGVREHGLGSAGHPLASAASPDDLLSYPWPSPTSFHYEAVNRSAKEHAGFFVVVGGFSPLFYLMADLCGMEKTLLDMHLKPEFTVALIHEIVHFYKGYFTGIASACRGSVDAIAFGDDFAGQTGMLMSPGMWRKFFKPAWAELFAVAKEHGYRVMFHSCGSMFDVIPDLIEIGLDVLYPVQPRARNMDLARLQASFGSRLCFYGGFDVQGLLPHGTVDEIRAETRRLLGLFAGGGGYILSTSHVIMDEVPLENVLALYEEAGQSSGQSPAGTC